MMRTYKNLSSEGERSPVFQIDNIYIGIASIAKVLSSVDKVTEVRTRNSFSSFDGIHAWFEFQGRPFIVWEPYGDNSRYWIGPADMVQGANPVAPLDNPDDILRLEDAFRKYHPNLLRKIVGDVVTLAILKK